jgi:4-amino-4-deoxy-L-arabinose transferase-like glycosyltransferase
MIWDTDITWRWESMAPSSVQAGGRHGAILMALMLLALILRTFPLVYSHNWDESVFLQNALVVLEGRTNYDEFNYRPPLLSFAYALGFLIWNSLYAPHVVQGLLALLPVAGIYLLTNLLAGRLAALIAVAIFALSPYIVTVSHQLHTDAPAVGLMLLSIWLFERRGKSHLFLAGLVFGAAILMRFNSMTLAGYFLLLAVLCPRRARDIPLLGAGVALCLLPYLLWAHARFGNFAFPFQHAHNIVTKWTRHDPVSVYLKGVFDIFPAIAWVGFLLGLAFIVRRVLLRRGTVAAGGGTSKEGASYDTRRLLALLAWGVLFFVHMASIPHKEVRYLLPLAIPVVVFAAIGFDTFFLALSTWRKRSAMVTGICLVALAGWSLSPVLGKLKSPWVIVDKDQNVRIAEFVRDNAAPGDKIYAVTWFPVLALYSGLPTVSLLPIQERFDAKWENLMAAPGYFVWYHMGADFENHSRSDVLLPDRAFLDSNPAFRKIRQFESAIVYRYVPGRPASKR